MGTNPPPGPGPGPNPGAGPQPGPQSGPQAGFGERLEDLWARIEDEVRLAVTYVNDRVVPEVRKESVSAMRNVADALRNLADKIEKTQSTKGPQG